MSAPIINNATIVLNWQTGANTHKFVLLRSGGGSDKNHKRYHKKFIHR